MKTLTSALILFLGVLSGTSAWTADPVVGQSVKFVFQRTQSALEITQVYPSGINLADVITLMNDDLLQDKISDFTVGITRRADPSGGGRYYILTTGEVNKFGFTAQKTVAMSCYEIRTAQSWTRNCQAALDQANTREAFVSAANQLRCSADTKGQVTCVTKAQVAPRKINRLVFVRSERQLAIAGAQETMLVLAQSYYYLVAGSKSLAKAGIKYEQSVFAQLRNRLTDIHAQADRLGDKTVTAIANEITGAVTILGL